MMLQLVVGVGNAVTWLSITVQDAQAPTSALRGTFTLPRSPREDESTSCAGDVAFEVPPNGILSEASAEKVGTCVDTRIQLRCEVTAAIFDETMDDT